MKVKRESERVREHVVVRWWWCSLSLTLTLDFHYLCHFFVSQYVITVSHTIFIFFLCGRVTSSRISNFKKKVSRDFLKNEYVTTIRWIS